jgi:hypothetical protein
MRKNAKVIVGALVCGIFVGCGDSSNGGRVAKGTESPTFGSATDVSPSDGRSVDTNALNTADNGMGGTPQRVSGQEQSKPLAAQGLDQELAKQIKVALTTGSMGTTGAIAEDQLTKIDVRVHNGVVALSGPVSSEAEKRTIEKQVAGMKGVRSVRNMLTVGGRNVEDKAIEPLVPRTPGNQ